MICSLVASGEHAVEHERVDVHVQIQCATPRSGVLGLGTTGALVVAISSSNREFELSTTLR